MSTAVTPKNTELLQTTNHFLVFFIKDCQTDPYEYVTRDNTSNNKTHCNNMSSKGSELKRRIMLEEDPKKTVCLSHFTMIQPRYHDTTKKSKKMLRIESERVQVNRINEQFYK